MEITTTTINRNPDRRAAVNALAIVGFIALLIIGIGLAIYSARFVPNIASRFGGAAVSLSSIFKKSEDPALEVVTATTTLPFEGVTATTTTAVATSTEATTTPVKHTGGTGSAGGQSTTVTTVVTTPVTPYGNPDLAVIITDVGYLSTNGNTSTFVHSTNVPFGKTGAVKFTVTNAGTNVASNWSFNVDVPTSPSQNFASQIQSSLAPGDSIDYTLGFDRGSAGTNRVITVAVDRNNVVIESNENNNIASRSIDIYN
jgi:hypothetical protein